MPSPSNQPHQPFVKAYDYWDIDKLLQDLAIKGNPLSDAPQKVLRGALLGKPPRQIAEISRPLA